MTRPMPLRWRFPDPREADARAKVQQRIDAWWRAFSAKTQDLEALFTRRARWDLPGWMHEHLHAITPDIFWEFGPGLTTRRRLVITAESNRHRRPLVSQILRSAPSIDGWEFLPFRPAETLEEVEATVKGRTGVELSLLSATAKAGALGTVELTLFSRKDEARRGGFVAAEGLLGEETLERWFGVVEPARGAGQPLASLKAEVDALIAARQARLPSTQWHARIRDATWSLLKLEPPSGKDLPAQRDLFLGKTVDVELFEACRNGRLFDSQRFSRCGETFAYLKVDGSEGLQEGGFKDKSQIEDAVDAVLIPAGLGCHIGGGTGRRYAYVDLALTDVGRALEVLLPAMRAGRLPRRSWVLFFDSDLRWEWVGIWPDSPPPPLEPLPE